MTGAHEIVVASEGNGWRVAIVPALELGDEPVIVLDHDIAMARARLMRLRHGFPIVVATNASKTRARR